MAHELSSQEYDDLLPEVELAALKRAYAAAVTDIQQLRKQLRESEFQRNRLESIHESIQRNYESNRDKLYSMQDSMLQAEKVAAAAEQRAGLMEKLYREEKVLSGTAQGDAAAASIRAAMMEKYYEGEQLVSKAASVKAAEAENKAAMAQKLYEDERQACVMAKDMNFRLHQKLSAHGISFLSVIK